MKYTIGSHVKGHTEQIEEISTICQPTRIQCHSLYLFTYYIQRVGHNVHLCIYTYTYTIGPLDYIY